MKEENNTPSKIKMTSVEVFVLLIVLLGFAFYFIPKGLISIEKKQYGVMQTNAAIMTSKVLAEFSNNEKDKKDVTAIAYKLAEELNQTIKNPMKKQFPAYSVYEECQGCVVLTPDKKIGNITLIAHDKDGNIVTRTIIQPPSYVTYNKEYESSNDD